MGTWSVGLGGFLLGVVAFALKDWLGAKGTVLLDFLYGRFAGSRLLRRAALAKYTRELYRRHEKFPVSFRTDESLKLPMESVYVPLRGDSFPDSSRDLLDPLHAALHRARHNVVLGVPGAGKTMLLRHETLDWARRRIRDGRRKVDLTDLYDIPVLLELHRLAKDPDLSLEEHISRHFARHGFPRAQSWVARSLEQGRLSLYFDGLDEVATGLRGRVVEVVKEFAETYGRCRIVVTCRVAVYDGQFTEFDQTLTVRDFDEHLIRRFLGGWPWRSGTAAESVDQLLGALRDAPEIMQLARNPLLLTLIAYLYDFKYAATDQALPHTRAEFYKQVIDDLLGDRHRGAAFPHPVKKAVLLRLALVAQDVPSGTHDRLALPEAEVLKTVREVLVEQGRDAEVAEQVLREVVERSGLLLSVDNGERYQFAHLTLQEYLAAAVLAADPSGLLRRYEADPEAWRETVRLWCGVEPRDCTGVVQAVWLNDPVLAFQCLAEAHAVDEWLAAEVLDQFEERLRQGRIDEQMIAAFGLVAGDRRQRGRKVFGFLMSLAGTGDTDSAWVAGQALAATNLPAAATALARATRRANDPAWNALTLMGDLAVPAFGELADQYPEAFHTLWSIRTPKAARELNQLFWNSSHRATRHLCAFYLGELLTVPEIEADMRTAPVPTDATEHESWVWRPFADGPDDQLVKIAGRIAWVLNDLPVDELSHPPAAMDPRITAALTVIDPAFPKARIAADMAIPEALRTTFTEILPSLRSSPYRQQSREFLKEIANRIESVYVPTTYRAVPEPASPAARLLEACTELIGLAQLPARRLAMLRLLPPWLRLRACAVLLLAEPLAGPETWYGIPRAPIDTPYDFSRSWYFRFVIFIWIVLSGIALWPSLTSAVSDHPVQSPLLGWTGLAVMLAWLFSTVVLREAGQFTGGRWLLLGLTVLSALYFAFAVAAPWGLAPASACAVSALGLSAAGVLRGTSLQTHHARLSHPVRRLVLSPLVNPTTATRRTHH